MLVPKNMRVSSKGSTNICKKARGKAQTRLFKESGFFSFFCHPARRRQSLATSGSCRLHYLSHSTLQHLLEVRYPNRNYVSKVLVINQSPDESNLPKPSSRIPTHSAIPTRALNDASISEPHPSLEVRSRASSGSTLCHICDKAVAVGVEPRIDEAHCWLLGL
jgi:hypothetical protein